MPLADVLTTITALGFDTAPFIYFVERHPRYVDMMRDRFGHVDNGSVTGHTSTIKRGNAPHNLTSSF
jgi:hypothetical protein